MDKPILGQVGQSTLVSTSEARYRFSTRLWRKREYIWTKNKYFIVSFSLTIFTITFGWCQHESPPKPHINCLSKAGFGSALNPNFSNKTFRAWSCTMTRLYQLSDHYKSLAMPREAASFSVTHNLHTSSHSQIVHHNTRVEKWGGCSSSHPSNSWQWTIIHKARVCVFGGGGEIYLKTVQCLQLLNGEFGSFLSFIKNIVTLINLHSTGFYNRTKESCNQTTEVFSLSRWYLVHTAYREPQNIAPVFLVWHLSELSHSFTQPQP